MTNKSFSPAPSNLGDPTDTPASTDTRQAPKDKVMNQILKLYFSLRSRLTPSSIRSESRARANRDRLELIGEGRAANVWDLARRGQVVKQAKPGFTYADLIDDFYFHSRVHDDLEQLMAAARAPRPSEVMDSPLVQDWCFRSLKRGEMPDDDVLVRAGTAIMVAEKIPPVPGDVRAALVHAFCPRHRWPAAVTSPRNNNCLVRVHLGRHDGRSCVDDEFGLWDFELTLDRMERLDGVDPVQFVDPMAEALAIMHWKTRCDAAGVEFVLGTSPEVDSAWGPRTPGYVAGNGGAIGLSRAVRMFVLDFDEVDEITLDKKGVNKAVKAYLDNKPFFPEPVSVSYHARYKKYHLWRCFKKSYLEVSAMLLPGNKQYLADLFLERVEEEHMHRLTGEVAWRSVLAVIPEDSEVLDWWPEESSRGT